MITFSMDPLSKVLGTGYSRFDWDGKIYGLMRANERTAEILAVASIYPGKGDFRDFIAYMKPRFHVIKIWHVDNPFLPAVLERYGFRPWTEKFCFQGEWETCEGYRWDH